MPAGKPFLIDGETNNEWTKPTPAPRAAPNTRVRPDTWDDGASGHKAVDTTAARAQQLPADSGWQERPPRAEGPTVTTTYKGQTVTPPGYTPPVRPTGRPNPDDRGDVAPAPAAPTAPQVAAVAPPAKITAATVAGPNINQAIRPTMGPGQAAEYTRQSVGGSPYDEYTKKALGASPEDAMRLAQAAAQSQAQGQAQMASDQAIRQAIKGAKTAGATGGQAALAAQGQGAGAYTDAYTRGLESGQQQYFNTAQLGAQLGSEMSSRAARAAGIEAGQEASRLGAQTSMYGTDIGAQLGKYGTDVGAATSRYGTDVGAESSRYAVDRSSQAAERGANQQLFGNILGTVGGIATLFSDRNLKEGIKENNFSDSLGKIKSYTYRYKGQGRPEAGVMAQELEQTAMAPAVMETPAGKMIDTRRLSTMNTAALSEHEKRIKDVERLVKGLSGIER